MPPSLTETDTNIVVLEKGRGMDPLDIWQLRKSTIPLSPSEEAYRLKILRETQLLDTATTEDIFDRYSHFAKRLFGVQVCTISLVDRKRVWFKSVAGKLSATESCREGAFASATVATCGDVYLVNDTHEHDEYKSSPLVVGAPHIRFYVGAPIVVEKARIGSLCLFDFAPRQLDESDIKTLLDFGEVVSDIIRERRNASVSRYLLRSQMIQQLMHNLRTPLQTIEMSTTILTQLENDENPSKNDSDALAHLISTVDMAEEELYAATSHLVLLVESSLNLSEIIVDTSLKMAKVNTRVLHPAMRSSIDYTQLPGVGPQIRKMMLLESNKNDSSRSSDSVSSGGAGSGRKSPASPAPPAPPKKCHVLGKIYDARRKLDSIFNGKVMDVEWNIDVEGYLSTVRRHHPLSQRNSKVVYFVILRSVEQFVSRWHRIQITARFETGKARTKEEQSTKTTEGSGPTLGTAAAAVVSTSPKQNLIVAGETASSSSSTGNSAKCDSFGSTRVALDASTPKQWLEGHLHFTFVGSDPRKEKSFTEEAHLDFYSVEEVLLDVEGWSQRYNRDTGEEVIDCWIPHMVSIAGVWDHSSAGSRCESVAEINSNRISRTSSSASASGNEDAAVRRKFGAKAGQTSGIWVASTKIGTPIMSPKPGFFVPKVISGDRLSELVGTIEDAGTTTEGNAPMTPRTLLNMRSSDVRSGGSTPKPEGATSSKSSSMAVIAELTSGEPTTAQKSDPNPPATQTSAGNPSPSPYPDAPETCNVSSAPPAVELNLSSTQQTIDPRSSVVRPAEPKPSGVISPRVRISQIAAAPAGQETTPTAPEG